MASHKYIDRVCAAALALTLVLTLLFVNGQALGLQAAESAMGYEGRLFDPSRVHTIDIIMDDWDGFLETCENEEYQLCALVIDGEAERHAAIRAKGNTSLTSVAAYGNDRYSFKVEFDHYDSGNTYYGLDKLSLNNLIQDNTFMKDFLVYQLMARFGAAAPKCSYVSVSVNGEPWGLYLAVEGVEDAFLQRNYGSGYGNLYKPDSSDLGGGRGNGGGFKMEELPENFDGRDPFATISAERNGQPPEDRQQVPGGFGGGFGGMGSSDVKLQYVDDDPDSYANIFDNAKTDVTEADKSRLIRSLQVLSSGENAASVVDVERVIRYFVVHGFVCNGDSYTGSMVHNYYLYEDGGILSMIPWDYNLAFGGFQAGDAAGAVNEPIDTPVSGGSLEDRPMLSWIFADEDYTRLYHQYYDEFLSEYLESGVCQKLIEDTAAMIAPYVAQDPTKFCTFEEFEAGVAALQTFCELRTRSVWGQLDGTVPATTQGQQADSPALIDASGLDLSDMGTMTMGGGGQGGRMPEMPGNAPAELPDGESVPAFAPGREDFASGRQQERMDGRPNGAPQGTEGSAPAGDAGSNMPLLVISVIVLAAGLVFAVLFRRRR